MVLADAERLPGHRDDAAPRDPAAEPVVAGTPPFARTRMRATRAGQARPNCCEEARSSTYSDGSSLLCTHGNTERFRWPEEAMAAAPEDLMRILTHKRPLGPPYTEELLRVLAASSSSSTTVRTAAMERRSAMTRSSSSGGKAPERPPSWSVASFVDGSKVILDQVGRRVPRD